MDSKSVKRVCESLSKTCRYDSKLRLWSIEPGLTFTSAEIASMSSLDFRKKVGAGNGGNGSKDQKHAAQAASAEPAAASVATAAQEAPAADGTGGGVLSAADQEYLAKVAEDFQKRPPAPTMPPIVDNTKETDVAKKVKKGKTSTEKKRSTRDAGVYRIALASGPLKPKRTSEANKDRIWLKGMGIHKWQLRRKMKARDAGKGVMDLVERATQYYAPSEMKDLLPHIFSAEDKAVLAKRDDFSKQAIQAAEEARAIAERVLAACK